MRKKLNMLFFIAILNINPAFSKRFAITKYVLKI